MLKAYRAEGSHLKSAARSVDLLGHAIRGEGFRPLR
jgi:hypothetical protein